MSKRNEHLVVVMVEPPPVAEFIIWPMHITIVPWFGVGDEAKLDKLLRGIAVKHRSFDVAVGNVEQWGQADKFNVISIADSVELKSLHWDVFDSLQKNGFLVHQKEFLGDAYKPHITLRNRKSRRLPAGETIAVISFSLIKQLRQKPSGTMIKLVAREYFLQ